ncbi:DNA pilot protein [Sigmofec virus UA08Rod_7256]|uniref:DNA pilot protein n=1 Tax=Sigmofec virus UA08Rod_7256 TaxID=2929244 RepID=A0A976R6S4_9VIRU|nr:DNA pilot protein [Sigmofec virus UA08Rod_7256]
MSLAALASIGGSLLGYKGQRDTNAQNYQMFKEQLEYDKPINQVARLKEAGLNPNLVYGSGIQNTQTVGKQPKFENPMEKAIAGLNVGLMRSQLDKAQADADLARTQANIAGINAQYAPVMNTFSMFRSIEDLRRDILNNERTSFDNGILFQGITPSFDRGIWSQASRMGLSLWRVFKEAMENGANNVSRPTSRLTNAATPVEGDFLNALTPASTVPAGSWAYGSSYH